MRLVISILFSTMLLVFISACSFSRQAAKPLNYSIELSSTVEYALLDGVPPGVNIDNFTRVIMKKTDDKLVAKGMKTTHQNVIVAKYELKYISHKFRPPKPRYSIKYRLEFSNKLNGRVISSHDLEADDSALDDLTDEISDDIVKKIVKESRKF